MFGYISIDKEKLKPNEIGLYQTFMCGICLSTKKLFGNYARAYVNYDINFFNVLFHSVCDSQVDILSTRCAASPFKKRTVIKSDELTDKLAVANVILTYLNIYDDVLDEKSLKKRIVLRQFRPSYDKAVKYDPSLNQQLVWLYESLRKEEKEDCNVLDKICHNFAKLSQIFAKIVLGEKANATVLDLCYNIGKWVYLIDALDDLKKDKDRGNYNPWIATLGQYSTADEFVKKNLDSIKFEMYATLNKIALNYNDLNLKKYRCLLNNIIYEAIRNKTADVIDSYIKETKC